MLDATIFGICVLAPPITSAVLILFITNLRSYPVRESLFLYTFGLHPEKGLMNHGLLWFSILTPIIYFITVGGVSWAPHTLNMSSEGFATFISISTLPLAILSLAIPLPVLVSRFHATQQTATQIRVTKFKNNVDVFYAHRKAMFEYFDKVPDVTVEGGIKCIFEMHPRLHLHAFKGSKPEHGMPLISKAYFEEIESTLFSARTMSYNTIYEQDIVKRLAFYRNACISIGKLSRMLLIKEIYSDLAEQSLVIKEKPRDHPRDAYLISMGQTTSQLIGSYRMCRFYYRILCEFTGYESDFLLTVDTDESEMSAMDEGRRYLNIVEQPVEDVLQWARETEGLDVEELT